MEGGPLRRHIQHLTTQELAAMGDSTAGAVQAAWSAALAVVNPVARGGRGAGVRRRVELALRAAFPALELVETESPGHAESLAAAWAEGHPDGILLVVGGDGTVHEAVNGLLGGACAGAALAVVP